LAIRLQIEHRESFYMSTETLVAIMVAIIAIAVAAWAVMERQKTRRLRDRFGPEYDRVIHHEKDARHAEAVLEERQKRVEKYNIRPLTREECDMFAAKWRAVQEHFVDEPRESVRQADTLITEAMQTRGYPMSDFDQRAADLSVDHPAVIEDYREAHMIAQRDAREPASTEDLRRAMKHYRSLFEHMLDTHVLQHH
jgi:FtsZ-interacting cell division protein ZipA